MYEQPVGQIEPVFVRVVRHVPTTALSSLIVQSEHSRSFARTDWTSALNKAWVSHRHGRTAARRCIDAAASVGAGRSAPANWRPTLPKTTKPPTKSATVNKLLSREKGATVAELAKATAWKDHSVRAFLTGIRKKTTLTKEQRTDGSIAYRLTSDAKSTEPSA